MREVNIHAAVAESGRKGKKKKAKKFYLVLGRDKFVIFLGVSVFLFSRTSVSLARTKINFCFLLIILQMSKCASIKVMF